MINTLIKKNIFLIAAILFIPFYVYSFGDKQVFENNLKEKNGSNNEIINGEINCFNLSITGWSLPQDTMCNFLFIPTEQTPIKRIRVNIHIIKDKNGENNFDEDNIYHRIYIKSIFSEVWGGSVNGRLAKMEKQVSGGDTTDNYYVRDSRLRFQVEGIYFHTDNGGLDKINGTNHFRIGEYCKDNFGMNMDTEFNIFFIPDGYHADKGNIRTGGYGPPRLGNTNPLWIGKVVMYNVFRAYINHPGYKYPYGGWNDYVNPLIIHEFGHVFGLHHTNHKQGSYKRFFPELPWPEEFRWDSPESDSISNNIMGGSNRRGYLSPRQIGHIHRIFTINPARRRYLKD